LKGKKTNSAKIYRPLILVPSRIFLALVADRGLSNSTILEITFITKPIQKRITRSPWICLWSSWRRPPSSPPWSCSSCSDPSGFTRSCHTRDSRGKHL